MEAITTKTMPIICKKVTFSPSIIMPNKTQTTGDSVKMTPVLIAPIVVIAMNCVIYGITKFKIAEAKRSNISLKLITILVILISILLKIIYINDEKEAPRKA